MRGFASIGLVRPKNSLNIGSVLRAAACYDASLVVVSGERYKRASTDTTAAYRHIPVLHNVEDIFDANPFNAVPVAVDLVPNAIDLRRFAHPESAFYIFGPEDGTLGKYVVDRCKYAVMVPTSFCMNLAAAVNVVLYDRMAKVRQ